MAALHHSLQDGTLQEVVQFAEFLLRLTEALGGYANEGRAGCFACGHDLSIIRIFEKRFLLLYYRSIVENNQTFLPVDVTFAGRLTS
jgi:hypothetical protein